MELGETTYSKEALLYLDFNDKIPQELLDDKIFIRVANLEDKSPLVQINDMIFKGTYDHSIGTTLIFKKTSNKGVKEFPFQQQSNFELEFFEAQTNILNCKQMRVPPTTATVPETSGKILYNFKWDYQELLSKLEQGTLDLNDMTEQKDSEPPEENISKEVSTQTLYTKPPSFEQVMNEDIDVIEVNENPQVKIPEEQFEELKSSYEALQELARRPVKRNITVETVECDPKYRSSYDYKSIECKVLEPPLFSYLRTKNNFENTTKSDVHDSVDVNRCIRLGLIDCSNDPSKKLSENEKKKIFTIENFENLSLTARYSVLLSHLEALEKQVNSSTSEENVQKDEYNHTPIETLEIFKDLVLSLQNKIQVSSI